MSYQLSPILSFASDVLPVFVNENDLSMCLKYVINQRVKHNILVIVRLKRFFGGTQLSSKGVFLLKRVCNIPF